MVLGTKESIIARREIATERYILSTLPVLYINFKKDWQGSGKFVTQDGAGRVATVTGALWTPNGQAILDGSDDVITLPGAGFNFITDAFSVEAWIKLDTRTSSPSIITNSTSAEAVGWEFYVQSGGAFTIGTCQTPAAQQYSYTSAGVISLNVWHHCLATRNGASGRTYVNGVDLTNTVGTLINPTTSPETLRIGGDIGVQWLDGLIGEVRIYNRALSAVEVQRNYLATRWKYQ